MRRKRKGKRERLLERYVRFMESRHGAEIEFRVDRTEIERWGRWNRSGSRYVAYVRIPGTGMVLASFTRSRRSDAIGGLLLRLAGEEKTCEEIEMELESGGF